LPAVLHPSARRLSGGGTFGYYAQKLNLFIHSGLPQFLDTAWRGLTM